MIRVKSLTTWMLLVVTGMSLTSFVRGAAPTVDEVLEAWSKKTDVSTIDARLMCRELDPLGKWKTEQPTEDRFRYDRASGQGRLDRLANPAITYLIEGRVITIRSQGKEEQAKGLGVNDALPTHLWMDSFPAFFLVGVDPATLRRDFEIRSLQPTDREIQLYFYPQKRSHRDRFQRLEVRLSSSEMIAVEIHVVWKDNSHTFWAVLEPKTDVALHPEEWKTR
ncbi:hypothetical protein K2X85_11155 [bacterium]|nr:hypothetical protein [bacterium]